jgi:hypothetical protein
MTCPADLLTLHRRGVKVFSMPNLHAKVYLIGRTVYIGSANVSSRSAIHLIEAMLYITDTEAVVAAREFVSDLCLHKLTYKQLIDLSEKYEPPKMHSKNRAKAAPSRNSELTLSLPPPFLAQIVRDKWSEEEQSLHDKGMVTARKRQRNFRRFELDSFSVLGKCPYQDGDPIIQVTDEGNGQLLVSPPGNVLYVESGIISGKRESFVYLAVPANKRRRSIQALTKQLGRGSGAKLRKDGLVSNSAFAEQLLGVWHG